MLGYRLRPATAGDAEEVAAIWLAGWRESHLGQVPAALAAARTPESPSHRGSGVAAALLAEALRQIAAAGHRQSWLAVIAGNARARRFYERSGWTDEGAFDYEARTADGMILVRCHRYVRPVAA